MKKKIEGRSALLASVLGAGLSAASAQAVDLPRGADVDQLAGNCRIGNFQQTTKAGPYNALCNVMQDSEKCLGLLKGQFHYNGQTVQVQPVSSHEKRKALYCLYVLKRELGL